MLTPGGLGLTLEALSLTIQHILLPAQAGNRDFLFWITFRARLAYQASWPGLVLRAAGCGVATSLGGPVVKPALPHTSRVTLGEPLQWLVSLDLCGDNNTT